MTDEMDEVEYLKTELDHFENSGIIEVAVRNPNVSEYMEHWEGRVEKAEAERDKLNEAVWQALDDMRSGQCVCLATKQMLADAYIRDSDPADWPVGLGETENEG